MSNIDKSYFILLESLKEKIRVTKQTAVLAINKQILIAYWEIGNVILQQQQKEGWGTKVIDRLRIDLITEFPDMKGLSIRNIKYMRAFAGAWPEFVQHAAAQIYHAENQSDIIVQHAAAQLPWVHHQVILDKIKGQQERIFYVKKAVEHGWSRNILIQNINSQLHLRQGQAITNFSYTLPPAQSDLARETLKNPYLFDFLGMTAEMQERDLEKALVQHMKKFMLELGRGFSYVGNQYNLNVQGDEFFLDLLFFNYRLDCFVVFELKTGEFRPEYSGKLNFYINTVDEQIKLSHHKPTIGVLLCKTPNETMVKYALKGIDTPMGVAEYELTTALPRQLKGEMPTVEEFEMEIDKEAGVIQRSLDLKKNKLKGILSRLKGEEIKKAKTNSDIQYLFEHVVLPIKKQVQDILHTELDLFARKEFQLRINNTSHPFFTLQDLEAGLLNRENIWILGFEIFLDGFKPAGTNALSVRAEMLIEVFDYKYLLRMQNNSTEYLYHYQWTEDDLGQTAEQLSESVLDLINSKLESIS
ncbi:MAG: DUF1016 family protein [Niastella sp.]|nr:DUF1016 family protein [Niastella sp.]